MRTTFLMAIAVLLLSSQALAQNTKKVQNIVDKELKAYQKVLEQNGDYDALMKEFSLDTFRVEHTFSATISDMVNSPQILEAGEKATAEYDKLLNKYYNKLLTKLKSSDKKVLIKAQKAWLSFRDAEQNLTGTMSAEQYSGGGSIQKDINESTYQELVKSRLVNIFNHLNRISAF
jgi:uncharacterized protein YecT (DUF1311 family)